MSASLSELNSDPYFKVIVSRLKAEFHPKKLFLFGSRAYGKAREDSDYDFVLVADKTERGRIENLIRASEICRDIPISIDVFVYPETEFLAWKDEFNSLPEIASTTGIEVNLADF